MEKSTSPPPRRHVSLAMGEKDVVEIVEPKRRDSKKS